MSKSNKKKEIDLSNYVKNDDDFFLEENNKLKNYHDRFNKEKERTEFEVRKDPEEKINRYKIKNVKPKTRFNILIMFLFIFMFLSSIAFIGYTILFGDNQINQVSNIINSFLFFGIAICMMVSYGADDGAKKKAFGFLGSITITGLLAFNLLTNLNILNLPTNSVMKDFTGKTITEAMKWADANKITIEQVYDNSDTIEEFNIIMQDIYPNILLKNVDKVEFRVSSGPDYDKEVVLPNMIDWNIDEAVKQIDSNFLNNVDVNFEGNVEIERDIIISQSKSGNMKRNDKVEFTVSLGDSALLESLDMIDIKNMSYFKAGLWLKRNGIKFNVTYEFSDKVKRNHVISQSITKGKNISPHTDTIDIVVSRGKKIIVPDLSKMNMKEITKWIVDNRLKIEFSDKYDMKIKKGKVIESNYKEKDEIEEGSLVKIVTSKGQLKMPKFTSLDEFRRWANRYGVKYTEEYIQDKNVEKGKIIKFSANPGDVLNTSDPIIVYISSGDTIVVPNFVGRKKADIEKMCKDTGLQCTFYYAGVSSRDKDIALSQNKRAGSEVVKDTYVNVGLSSGKTSNNPNVNTGNTKPATPNPIPTPTPVPTCNTTVFRLQPHYVVQHNPTATCNNVKNAYPGYNIVCNLIDSDTGYQGAILQSPNGQTINSCNAVSIVIRRNA